VVSTTLVSRFVSHACHSALESRGVESTMRSVAFLSTQSYLAVGSGAKKTVACNYKPIGKIQ
jgi:hypothetical protein